jgi:hypothetical protein
MRKKKANRTTDAQASAPGSPGWLTAIVSELELLTGGRGPEWRELLKPMRNRLRATRKEVSVRG